MGDLKREAMGAVRAVYAELEGRIDARDCTGRTTCCRFLLTGKTPMLTAGEALVAAAGVRASGRKKMPKVDDAQDGRCPLLGGSGKCTVYADRPFGCRTHFCEAAGGTVPRKNVRDLIQRLEAVGEMLGDSDVRPISDAVVNALDKTRSAGRRR